MTLSRFALLASWWARWLANTAAAVAGYTALAAFVLPAFLTAAAWPWNAIGIAGLSAVTAATMMYAQQPLRQAYLTALHGLTREQRAQAITAVRRDAIPDDPAVLAGAIRVGALGMSYIKRITKTNRAARWGTPGGYLLAAVAQFFTHDPRRAVFWGCLAVYFAAYFMILTRRERRLPAQVERLRIAAADVPQAQAALADIARGTRRPAQRLWVAIVLGVVAVACLLAADSLWGSRPRISSTPHRGDCATFSTRQAPRTTVVENFANWIPTIDGVHIQFTDSQKGLERTAVTVPWTALYDVLAPGMGELAR